MNKTTRPVPAWATAVAALPAEWFRTARWFQAKAESVRSIRLVDVLDLSPLLPPGDRRLSISLVEVAAGDGTPELYLLPLCLEPTGKMGPGSTFAVGAGWAVREALDEPALHAMMIRLMSEGRTLAGGRGTFHFESFPLPLWRQVHSLAQNSTNSLILVKADVVCKFIRRLPAGQSPELEMSRFFAAAGTFQNLPPLEGALSYRDVGGREYTLVIARRFVENQGDLWHGTLLFLSHWLHLLAETQPGIVTEPPLEDASGYLDRVRRLARVLATMHRTLSAEGLEAAFAPEPITPADLAGWCSTMTAGAAAILDKIASGEPGSHPATRDFYERLPEMRRQILAAFSRLTGLQPAGWVKCRVHGDFHLGQVLLVGNDCFVMDFEGEPLKASAQRVAKYSPLKDVAGLLRSFHYAMYAALFEWEERHALSQEAFGALECRLAEWSRLVEQVFRETYFAEMGWIEDGGLSEFLAVLKLEKAVYELDYEINNRPAWLPIPCNGIKACLKEILHT
ncbi:MAG TPA: phosphotransferase [Acidobacteriota bacterium]|nr:phosphotransferase [Acidobacteriota bacterium]HQG90516.1 phosphotransferase [Acidobacteriota bacterium]